MISKGEPMSGSAAPRARKVGAHEKGKRDSVVEQSVTINRTAEELYDFWRDLRNLPRFMLHLKSVEITSSTRSHWVMEAPVNKSFEWDAEITRDEPGKLISWRSLSGADIENTGTVRFERATGDRGTVVRVSIEFAPPGGHLGVALAKLFGEDPKQLVKEDLKRFKQLLEAGEIASTRGQPRGEKRGAKGAKL
jgi:uncharacterized membrane protein